MVLHGCGAHRVVLFALLFFTVFFQSKARAENPDSAAGVCERHETRGALDAMIADPRYRMSFRNTGGLGNAGVCWWHSRFQRAVWTLAEFHPELPKPNRAGAIRIIQSLTRLSNVIWVPGYSDLASFSADFKAEIQYELNEWQIRDGFINQAWIRGISGQYDLSKSPGKLREIMDRLFRYSEQGRKENFIPWIMLQLKGVDSHAALVVNMWKNTGGYTLSIVDSNHPEKTIEWKYYDGDGHMQDAAYVTIPYSGLHRDVRRMEQAVRQYCSRPAQLGLN